MCDTIKEWCFHLNTTVTKEGQVGIVGTMRGGEEIPLNVVKPCGMRVPQSEALDTSGSSHESISYLLRIEFGD